jgi:uncharacterized protein (TIGR03437 family)
VRGAWVAVLVAGCEGVDGPLVDEIVPASARRGEQVVIGGARFCAGRVAVDSDECEQLPVGGVQFGLEIPQVTAPVVTWNDVTIRVEVPDSVADGTTEIVVTANGRSSNAIDFEVVP